MKKYNSNKKNKVLPVTIIICVAIIVLLFISKSSSFIDKSVQSTNFGEATLSVSSCNWLCQLTQPTKQTIYFSATEKSSYSITNQPAYIVGQTVSATSYTSCADYTSGSSYLDVALTVYIQDTSTNLIQSITMNLYNQPNNKEIQKTFSITTSSVGKYKMWESITCYKPGTKTSVYSVEIKDLARYFTVAANTDKITCLGERVTNNLNYPVSTSGFNNVLSITCELWVRGVNTNGVCSDVQFTKNCKTTCQTGSFCDNTYSSTTCIGQVSCVKQPTTIPEPTPTTTTTTTTNPTNPTVSTTPTSTPTTTVSPSTTQTPVSSPVIVGNTNKLGPVLTWVSIILGVLGIIATIIVTKRSKR